MNPQPVEIQHQEVDVRAALFAQAAATPHEPPTVPPVQASLAQAGVTVASVEALLVKLLYARGEVLGRELAAAAGLRFSLIEPIVENLKRQHVVQVRVSLGMGLISAALSLSEQGRSLAREYMQANQYTGRVPVPMHVYAEWVHRQKRRFGWLTQQKLREAYKHMVLRPEVLGRLGPAVNSGSSFLIYGQPGNGKTYLAEALAQLDDDTIYIPYAIECNGAIVQLFDPVYHKIADEDTGESIMISDSGHDQRFAKIRRPFIVSGGELSMDMLNLTYSENAKIYDAPLQMKANNGIYLMDDFGRQLATPAQILNRWIIPLERRVDYLNLKTGGKVTVPFEAFLVFSTNLRPEDLGDEAFLRRIRYKLFVQSPDVDEFLQIFLKQCDKLGLMVSSDELQKFIEERYLASAKPFRRCHPRDMLTQASDMIHFEGKPPALTRDVLDTAFASCFADQWEG